MSQTLELPRYFRIEPQEAEVPLGSGAISSRMRDVALDFFKSLTTFQEAKLRSNDL